MLVREEAVRRAESSSGCRGEAEAGRVHLPSQASFLLLHSPRHPGQNPGPGVVKGSGMQEVRHRCANSSQQAATVASHGARATQRAEDLKSPRRKTAPSRSWSMCCVGTLTSQVQGGAWVAQVSPTPHGGSSPDGAGLAAWHGAGFPGFLENAPSNLGSYEEFFLCKPALLAYS